MQRDHKEWLSHNFPNQHPVDGFLGMVEEVGELAHALLKHIQSIRGMTETAVTNAAVEDALGDLFIYMMSFCNTNGYNLEAAIVHTWEKVRERDWQANPVDGIVAEPAEPGLRSRCLSLDGPYQCEYNAGHEGGHYHQGHEWSAA
jgi:NTP pyrophosphatase (non-canonical NTP hydrolase)